MESELVIDSNYASLAEATRDTMAPREVLESLVLIDVIYVSFDNLLHRGQIVMHRDLESDVKDIFSALLAMRFPIESIVPIIAYDWDDERSMAENNSSGFNYRPILGTDTPSNHSFGRALDLNPALNPYYAHGNVYPANAAYDPAAPGTIIKDEAVVMLFEQKGWTWGGNWSDPIDYQHFQKAPK